MDDFLFYGATISIEIEVIGGLICIFYKAIILEHSWKKMEEKWKQK